MVWFFKINRVMWSELFLTTLNFELHFFLNHHHDNMMTTTNTIPCHHNGPPNFGGISEFVFLSFFFNFVNYESLCHRVTSSTTTNYCPMAAQAPHLAPPPPWPNYSQMATHPLHFTPTTAQQPSTHPPHTITINYSSMATHTSHHYHLKPSTPHHRGPRSTDVPKVNFLCFSLLY